MSYEKYVYFLFSLADVVYRPIGTIDSTGLTFLNSALKYLCKDYETVFETRKECLIQLCRSTARS